MLIRKVCKEDLPVRVHWMNNPSVYKTMNFVPPISLENTIKWHESHSGNNKRFDATFVDEEGKILAFGGLTNIDYTVRKAELYVFVNPGMQKQGLGTKATRLLCKYGFDVLELNKVYLYTNATNVGARKTYEKVGFLLEGVHREEKVKGETYEDRLYYGILRKDFDSSNTEMQMVGQSPVRLEDYNIDGRSIKIVRDDLFPQPGGGVKSRKSVYYESLFKEKGINACVTTGGIQSNHNRAIALMCAKNGWRCHLVYHGTKERFDAEKGNAMLVRLSGASVEFVEANQISDAMDAAMERFRNEGYNAYYIHGGGHDLPGGVALVEAVKELKAQCDIDGYKPEYIFHASGTGSTQAGIAVGLDLVGWSDVKLIGISVARQNPRGKDVVVDFANMLAKHYGIAKDYSDSINFNTDYLSGGYEQYMPEMAEYLETVSSKTGLVFDTTYSGKAFYGMMDILKKNDINDKIIFWHTGGLMNLMK